LKNGGYQLINVSVAMVGQQRLTTHYVKVVGTMQKDLMNNMSNKQTELYNENLLEQLITENEDLLQDIHAENYMGTDDDMPDAFENWITNLTLEEVQAYIKKYE
jgi:NAD/NADP transhydrogenase alpha subunit